MIYFLYIFLSGWQLMHTWPTDAKRFRIDDLGFVYTIEDQSVIKYDVEGTEQFVYSRMDLGMPQQMDTSDPLRPLIYYPETGSLVVLDNTLTEQRVLRLWDGNIGMPQWVVSGVNQEFWIYDQLNKELVRVDERLNRQVSTGYLPALTGRDPEIVGLAERHEQVIMADAGYGLYIFDRFGTLVRRIPIRALHSLRTHADGMILHADTTLYRLPYGGLEPVAIRPFQAEKEVMDMSRGKLYQLIGGQLHVYRKN
jgi:hypothetical protein